MKRFALTLAVAAVAFAAPAMAAKTDFTEGHRMNSIYSASKNDQVVQGIVKLSKSDVKNVQKSLRAAGYKTGPIDGIYGWQTRSAMKKFQADRNLAGAGKPTPMSLGALRVATRVDFDHKLSRNYN